MADSAAEAAKIAKSLSPDAGTLSDVAPLSKELVIGLVGYAGAGCSIAARRLELLLDGAGYKVNRIR